MIAPVVAALAVAAPGPCTAAQTRSVAYAFARAWTRGDLAAMERLVAPEPQFKWISAAAPGARFGPAAFDRPSFASYLQRRHRQHDGLTLTWFRFSGSDMRDDGAYGHFEFALRRRADDWNGGHPGLRHGKGAIVCRPTVRLAVWSMN
jgi:hypothetical protein